jgi:NAD(P)-dependent dehydrogenase (short-subunit alcohol dehydrogenase family)
MNMQNETALITGSTSGIGRAIAEHLLVEECKVAICSRSEEHVASTLSELTPRFGNRVIGFKCDVEIPEDLQHAVSRTVALFGSLRILVVNAGWSAHYGPFECLDPEIAEREARQVIGTNLIGTINTIAAVLPQMKSQGYGRIVTLSGGGADRPIDNMTIYSASKGGVLAFSRCLALELGRRHKEIKLNIFQPGMLKTGLTSKVNVVPDWKSCREVQGDLDLVLEHIGGNIEESTAKVIPFVLPSCSVNGRVFRGFSMIRIIRGGMKLQRAMKARKTSG